MNRISWSDILSDDEDEEFKISTKSLAHSKPSTHKIITRNVTSAISNGIEKNRKRKTIMTISYGKRRIYVDSIDSRW